MADEATATQLFERYRRWLHERHLPVTRPRDLVARTLFASAEHLSVAALSRQLRESGQAIGTATIYRALDLLVESGLVRAHDFGEGFKRYEPLRSRGFHGHLVCVRCGRVAEFSTDRFERLLPMVADEHGFQPYRHRVEVHGLCQGCRDADVGALVPPQHHA